MNEPTFISLFAGCGGSSLGYVQAGFRELAAVEIDDDAVETFKMNFPGVPVHHGDVSALASSELMRLAGVAPRELWVLDASCPCQGFSTIGQRLLADPRNALFKEFARLLRDIQPHAFVFENVSGLVKGAMKQTYLAILAELRAAGYRCRGEMLDASHYGVPQTRKRVVVVGVRGDLGIEPPFPVPQTRPPTVREAWADLDINPQDAPPLSPAFAAAWRASMPGDCLGDYFSHIKLHPKRPSPTILKSQGYGGIYHPTECRPITSAERRRLAGFPDSFKFTSWNACCERVGNSVPPPLMRAVAETLAAALWRRVG